MGLLRMKDVCARTGMSRQAIHFYVEAGLVDPPKKTGRTMAYYSESQVERILLVRKLQQEHFLPLKAIRELLEGGRAFTPAQRLALGEIKQQLSATTIAETGSDVELTRLLAQTKLTRREVCELERLGLVRIFTRGGRR